MLGLIPYGGAAATELFNELFGPPLEKRRQEWVESLITKLCHQMEKVPLDIEDLQSNDAFIDTVGQASQTVLRTSQQEKLDALRNAVLNAALPDPPEVSLQQMFISYVDTFTVWHLRILSLLDMPQKWFETNKPEVNFEDLDRLVDVLTRAYPELSKREAFYEQVFRDLHDRGLTDVDIGSQIAPLKSSIRPGSRTTEFGKQFLAFIAQPRVEG